MFGRNVNNCSTQTSLNLPCVNISWQSIALDKGKLQASQFAKTDREEKRRGEREGGRENGGGGGGGEEKK